MLKSLFRSTLIVGVMAVLAGIGAYWAITYLITHEEPVPVPELRGQDVVAALQLLSRLDLNAKLAGTEYSSTHAQNQVVAQDPLPGAQIKKGREIRLTLSQGALMVTLPDLIGLPLQEAHALLLSQGLCPGRISRTRDPSIRRSEPGASGTTLSASTAVVTRSERGSSTPVRLIGSRWSIPILAMFAGLGLENSRLR